jgi:hypothetical protein
MPGVTRTYYLHSCTSPSIPGLTLRANGRGTSASIVASLIPPWLPRSPRGGGGGGILLNCCRQLVLPTMTGQLPHPPLQLTPTSPACPSGHAVDRHDVPSQVRQGRVRPGGGPKLHRPRCGVRHCCAAASLGALSLSACAQQWGSLGCSAGMLGCQLW